MRKQIPTVVLLYLLLMLLLGMEIGFFVSLYIGRFSSTVDLGKFLDKDYTNCQPYSEHTHDCKFFSWDLMVAGITQHHILLPVPCTQKIGDDTIGHVRCITMANGKLYWVEPQSDRYWRV